MNASTPTHHATLPVLTPPDGDDSIETHNRDALTFFVARTRGFCWGVDRALHIAEQTIERFAGRRIFLTSAILHNPGIHRDLVSRGVRFLDREPGLWKELGEDDIVLLPAFGVSPTVLDQLTRSGALVVDTTCGSVAFVWRHVDRLARDGFTIVYHGRRGHEEAVATLGRLTGNTGDGTPPANDLPHPYVVLETLAEANAFIAFLEGRSSNESLRAELPESLSPAFDLERDLVKIGFANQTTMLASESEEMALRLQGAQAMRFPDDPLSAHFAGQETICRATDDRQACLRQLLRKSPDLVIVVGGFDSSNTSHLAAIAIDDGYPAYHIENARDLLSSGSIRHRVPSTGRVIETKSWLPAGEVSIGASSGASTPESSLRAVLDRVVEVARQSAKRSFTARLGNSRPVPQ